MSSMIEKAGSGPRPLSNPGSMERVLSRFFVKDPLSGRKDVEVIYVTSSNLKIVAYSHSRQVMRVTFLGSGKLRIERQYQYFNVHPRIFNALKRAGSKGRFFYYAIRTRYPYQRIV
jgi:hypothetical protein